MLFNLSHFFATRLVCAALLAFCLPSLYAFAQRWEYGGGVGGSVYKGDLAPSFNPIYTKPGVTGFVKNNLSHATALRFQGMYTSLTAQGRNSADVYIANLQPNSFSTQIIEVGMGLEYNFYNFRDPSQKRLRGTPYLFGGVGFFWFQPDSKEKAVTEFQPMIPLGFGYKYRINKNWNFGAEFVARKTFTDYLDGVSNTDSRGWQTGWKFTNDWYTYAGVTLSYTIYEIMCPFDYR